MASFTWRSEGEGLDLVLIHGWGMNAAVWQPILPLLTPHYRVHCVELPGYGENCDVSVADFDELAQLLLKKLPAKAIWIGWSLGGLVATRAALFAPAQMRGLITVASSPCFAARDGWKGIDPEVLTAFQQQLQEDYQGLINRFLSLQAMGSKTARQDIKVLKELVLSQAWPAPTALAQGLTWLQEIDLRPELADVSVPWLRVYGRLDGLVPAKSASVLDELHPSSHSITLGGASHAPFISHPDDFLAAILPFIRDLC
uniref:pimeloyl-ACP methyl ester esterase BioH n=1 Tax=Thaumasiovibrio occultus TaxID=1891184 RepID=UPI000B35844C|nr:pimeloyl-ACP methyl ester esterase BioH [Thaumasiovibrio occultus]